MSLRLFFISLNYTYPLALCILMIVFDEKVTNCNDSDNIFKKIGITVIVLSFICMATFPSILRDEINKVSYCWFIFTLTMISFSGIHVSYFFGQDVSILKCAKEVIFLNTLLSLPAIIVASLMSFLIASAVIYTFIFIIDSNFIEPLFEKKYNKCISSYTFLWCLIQLSFLVNYSTNLVSLIFTCIQTVFLFGVSCTVNQLKYKRVKYLINLSIILGLLSTIFEKIIDDKITPVGINSSIPSITFIFYLINYLKNRFTKKGKVSSIQFQVRELPPVVYASGCASVYKKIDVE